MCATPQTGGLPNKMDSLYTAYIVSVVKMNLKPNPSCLVSIECLMIVLSVLGSLNTVFAPQGVTSGQMIHLSYYTGMTCFYLEFTNLNVFFVLALFLVSVLVLVSVLGAVQE